MVNELIALNVPVPVEVQYTLVALIADPTKLTTSSSQIVWFIPALTTWLGVKFRIIKSVTVPVHGATAWAVTVNMIGVFPAISAALGL